MADETNAFSFQSEQVEGIPWPKVRSPYKNTSAKFTHPFLRPQKAISSWP